MSIASLIGIGTVPIIKSLDSLLDNIFTSKEEKLSKEIILERIQQNPYILQAEITKIEAASNSIWKSGWRPAIGWVCALALSYHYIVYPISQGFVQTDFASLLPLVGAMLGIGGLRTYEKVSGRKK